MAARFLAELYIARTDGEGLAGTAERVRAASESLARSGASVRCVSAIFVPEDETCFLLYEADTVDDVRDAATRAGFAFERITVAYAADAAKD